jgi:photosystem II stability/assembly factor-like uncharacterized protein
MTALAGTVAVLALGAVVPASAAGDDRRPGCQSDRRTVVHAGGAIVAGRGTFTPCLVDTGMTTGESGLAIDAEGVLLRSAASNPTGVAVSTDDGATWQRRPLPDGASTSIADGYLDPVTQRYFYSTASDSPVYFTDDHGAHWETGTFDSTARQDWNKVFSGRPVTPRASGYPSNIYYCNWTIPLGAVVTTRCFKSTDGGSTFVTAGPDIVPEPCLAEPRATPSVAHGRGIVDPRNGSIYLPVALCGQLFIYVSPDEGASWSRRTVTDANTALGLALVDQVSSPAWQQQNLGGRVNPVGPESASSQFSDALAMDRRGRLYAVWVDGSSYLPRLATSPDGGQTWTKPVSVTPPGVVQAVLPSLVVTPAGRVGLSYYGSTDRATWTGYLTTTKDATTAEPVFQTASVTPPGQPLMPEPCCWANGAQEYTAARWAPDGTLWAAFAASRASGDAEGVAGRLVPAR